MRKDVKIIIPSCNPSMAQKTQEGFKPYESEIFDGGGYPSLSRLYNDCIIKGFTNFDGILILSNDKVRGDSSCIEGILGKLAEGYGLAAYYRLGFFGFSKELIRSVGLFDENFLRGGYEDTDFKNRLIEADIGIWETTLSPYEESGSRWGGNNKEYYSSKWHEIIGRPYCPSCKMNGASLGYDAMSCHRSNCIVRLKEEPKEMALRQISEMDVIFHNWPLRTLFPKTWKESILPANNEHLRHIEVVNGIH